MEPAENFSLPLYYLNDLPDYFMGPWPSTSCLKTFGLIS